MISQWKARKWSVLFVLLVTAVLAGGTASSQQRAAPVTGEFERILRWPIPADATEYGTIDGDHLKRYIYEIVDLTREHRLPDEQQWGRISGTPVDTAMRAWLMEQFRRIGLEDVREDPFDLTEPQYFPHSWEVVALSGGKTVSFQSAHPYRGAPATPASGVELTPVWVGLGTEADFAGRDVRGKAAVVYSQPLQSIHDLSTAEFGSLERARDAGAAAVLVVVGVPGNFEYMPYGSDRQVPYFMMGMQDGMRLRELIEQDDDVRVRVSLDSEFVEGLRSATVWGTLPGESDEEILIAAHRDGWFDGAGDNASGVALMLGLAEHFAKIPRAERPRTLRFMGATGHHHLGPNDTMRLNEDQEAKSKIVLALNGEHTGWTETYTYGLSNLRANGVTPLRWYLRGSDKLMGAVLSAYSRFGVKTLQDPGPGGAGDIGRLEGVPIVSVIQSPLFFHSNLDTPENVPAANLEAVTRAFANIIDQANTLSREELVGPVAMPPDRAERH